MQNLYKSEFSSEEVFACEFYMDTGVEISEFLNCASLHSCVRIFLYIIHKTAGNMKIGGLFVVYLLKSEA